MGVKIGDKNKIKHSTIVGGSQITLDNLIERSTPLLHKRASAESSEWLLDAEYFMQREGLLTNESEKNIQNGIKSGDIFNAVGNLLAELKHFKKIGFSKNANQAVAENQITNIKDGENTVNKKNIFVVHGRNEGINRSMFSFLRAVGLNPIEWDEAKMLTGKGTPFIGEILDVAFSKAQAILVLFTPDEDVKLRNDFILQNDSDTDKKLSRQARPNVIFEAGMAMGYNPDKTILVEVGTIRPFSDVAGRHIVRLSDSPESRNSLVSILKTVGLDVNTDGKSHYLSEGNFTISNKLPIPIDLSSYCLFHNPSNTQTIPTLKEEIIKDNFAIINVDFTNHQPNFAGYAVLLGNDNWREYYQNDNLLTFSISGTINKIQLEIKGETQSLIFKETLHVSPDSLTYKYRLKDISKHASSFDKMTEIVFLLTPEIHSTQASFKVSNMQITDNSFIA
jgi:predicted nucleotide-binding protein